MHQKDLFFCGAVEERISQPQESERGISCDGQSSLVLDEFLDSVIRKRRV